MRLDYSGLPKSFKFSLLPTDSVILDHVVKGSIKKRRKKWGLSFKKIGDDVIAQKAVTSFKQVARHRMAFFKIKSTCPSDFPKNITLRYYEFCSKLYVHTVYCTIILIKSFLVGTW
jgi:hypothetical protein